jgi:hypothetical protein
METMTAQQPIKIEDMVKYLSIYLGEPSLKTWEDHIADLYNQKKKYLGDEQAKDLVKKNVCFSLMVRYKERARLPDPPQNILFGAEKWTQYDSTDWVAAFHKVQEEDERIKRWRNESLSLGVIYPIEYCPITRQAFNWLYDKAQDTGIITPQNKSDMIEKFQKLVLAYGGNVVCQIFTKNESLVNRDVINWRTNYFFERLIFKVFSIDQVLKIKKQELSRANSKLVKQIRRD